LTRFAGRRSGEGSAESPEPSTPSSAAGAGTSTTQEAPVTDTTEQRDQGTAPEKEQQAVAKQGTKQESKQESKQDAKREAEQEKKPRRSGRDAGKAVAAGANAVRSRIASLVWLVAVVCALFLAVGALLVALDMNRQNDIVHFIITTAHKLDFGKFKDFTGKNAATQSALTNWGIAAVIYLVVGKVLDRLIRP
jgi:uncharacterized membrane protein